MRMSQSLGGGGQQQQQQQQQATTVAGGTIAAAAASQSPSPSAPRASQIPPTESPASASAAPIQPLATPAAAASSQQRSSQSQSVRPSAATRRRQAQAQQPQPSAQEIEVDHGHSVAIAPSASHVSETPGRGGASAASPSAALLGPTPPAASLADSHSAAKPSRSSRPSAAVTAAAATALPSSRRAPAAAAAAPPKVVDDSTSFLAPFQLDVAGPGAAAPSLAPFLLFTHHEPSTDTLQLFLLQKGPPGGTSATSAAAGQGDLSARLYRYEGRLTSLRPHGLYMSGLGDDEYRAYVLNGLAQQDERGESYEHELITQPDEDEEGEGGEEEEGETLQRRVSSRRRSSANAAAAGSAPSSSVVRAQLRLYKRMGEKVTRVPVCIAHIRFAPLTLNPSTGAHPLRQSELEYKSSTSALVAALARWTTRLRNRRLALDRAQSIQTEEQRAADCLDAIAPDLTTLRAALLDQAATLLNEKKRSIRQMRDKNDILVRERDALLPKKPGAARDDDEISESESDSEGEGEGEGDADMDDIYSSSKSAGALHLAGDGEAAAAAAAAPHSRTPSPAVPAVAPGTGSSSAYGDADDPSEWLAIACGASERMARHAHALQPTGAA
jgi:hypothetical protein